MIIAKHGLLASAQIKRAIPSVRRVLLARADGIPVYDDAVLAERDAGAAVTATLAGLASTVTGAVGLGALDSVAVRSSDGLLVVQLIDHGHVLAVVADEDVDLVELRQVAAAAVRPLLGGWRVAASA